MVYLPSKYQGPSGYGYRKIDPPWYVSYRREKGHNSVKNKYTITQPFSEWSAHEILIVYKKLGFWTKQFKSWKNANFNKGAYIQSVFVSPEKQK